MKKLLFKTVDISPELLADLEERGLIKRFLPCADMLNLEPEIDRVDTVYSSDPVYGSHKLICVGKSITNLKLTSHPDNEEFIIMNPLKIEFKPLYLVIGLVKHAELQKKAEADMLSEDDIIVIRLKYNDPETSLFIMLKDTPHWECTAPGAGKAPVFFVTEPTDLGMEYINLGDYVLKISE